MTGAVFSVTLFSSRRGRGPALALLSRAPRWLRHRDRRDRRCGCRDRCHNRRDWACPSATDPAVTDVTRTSLTAADYCAYRDSRDRRDRCDRRRAL